MAIKHVSDEKRNQWHQKQMKISETERIVGN